MLETEQLPQHFNLGKWFFLGVISILMMSSGFMGPLTPFPLALAYLLYGRKMGLGLNALGVVASFLLFVIFFQGQTSGSLFFGVFLFVSYFICSFIAVFVAESIFMRMTPMEGIVKVGSIVLFFLAVTGLVYYLSFEGDLKTSVFDFISRWADVMAKQKEKLTGQATVEMSLVLDFLSDPKKLSDTLWLYIPRLPGYIASAVFFVIWVTYFLLLRSRRVIPFGKDYPYNNKSLTAFKMPDHFLWPVLACLTILLLGEPRVGLTAHALAESVLRTLGIFYFFQGFGVYIKLLDFLKLWGVLRAFLIVFTVYSASWLLAFVGLLDVWFDFRKILKKKSEQNKQE